MRRPTRILAGLGTLAIVSALGWWLFGWSTEHNLALGKFTHQRFLGRVTTVYLDSNGDGRPDAKASYPWDEPFQGVVDGVCVNQGVVLAEDRDFDGRWDVWSTNLGRSQPSGCIHEFKVDTNGDGEADWSFRTADSVAAYDEIADRRGF